MAREQARGGSARRSATGRARGAHDLGEDALGPRIRGQERTVDLASVLAERPDDLVRLAAAESADAPPARTRRAHWRQLLAGSSPREVLARLLAGDPLELARHAGEGLRRHAFLLDADRVVLRAMARCARMAARYRGAPELELWLRERVDEALLDLVREDAEALRRGEPPGAVQLAAFVALARPLGLDPAAMRAACAHFNLLPLAERAAFRALVIEGRSLDELARSAGEAPLSASEVARRARRGLEALLVAAGEEARP